MSLPVSLYDLLEAFCHRWDARQLDDQITNGLHLQMPAERESFPYCVLSVVGDTKIARASNGPEANDATEWRRAVLDLTVYAESISAAGALAKQIKAVFDECDLNPHMDQADGVAEGGALQCEFTGGLPLQVSPEIGSWTVSYQVDYECPVGVHSTD